MYIKFPSDLQTSLSAFTLNTDAKPVSMNQQANMTRHSHKHAHKRVTNEKKNMLKTHLLLEDSGKH